MEKHLILMGVAGQRVIFDPQKLEVAEEIDGGSRLHMNCGAEIDAWGLRFDQLWDEVRKYYGKENGT